MTWLYYIGGVALATLVLTAIAQWQFNKLDQEELPKDLSMEAFKAATKPKDKLKELE